MLPPDYLDYAVADVLELYNQLDESIVNDMVRRIVKTGNISATTDWQAQMLQQSGLLYDDIIRQIAEKTDATEQQIAALFEDAAVESVTWDNEIYEAAGLSPPPLRQSPSAVRILNAEIQKTAWHLQNLTMTTATTSQTAFINAMTLAEMQVASGAFDYITAVRNAVKTAAQTGSTVTYPSGHVDKLDVAARRAILTGVGQTVGKISEQYADDMGCDLMEVTAHPGARPEHAAWQGKLVSRKGRKGYLSLSDIGYGTGPGFKGWNCRHDWFPFFEGLSESAYPREKLREYEEKKVVFNDTEMSYYDATQLQRSMERQVRATKRQLIAYDTGMKGADSAVSNALQEEYIKTSVGLKEQEARLREFTKQTGISRKTEREQKLGFGRSQAQKAVQINKKAKSYESLIGVTTSTGVTVTEISKHFAPQAIARNVSAEDARDALRYPLKAGKIRVDKSQQFFGEHATTAINTETGKLITVWKTGAKKAAKLKGEKSP